MIFKKITKTPFTFQNKGTILVDVLLALSLFIIFISIITESSIQSRQIFEKAKNREVLLNLFVYSEDFFGLTTILNPDQSLALASSTGNISAKARWYGNEMIQTDILVSNASSSGFFETSLSNLDVSNTVNFTGIRPFDLVNDIKLGSAAICSVNFSNKEIEIIPILLPTDPSLPLTDFQVRNGIAYISVDSNVASDPDLFIIDISNSSSTSLISSLNTGPGLSSIALVGRRIFASAPSTVAELHTIRLDGLDRPILENRYRLPLPYATATPALGSAIFYDDNKIYLGTEKWNGEEFNIIDITDPNFPIKISGYEIGSKINSIFVYKDIAYVTASSYEQLLVFDVSDRTNPHLIGAFSPSGFERQEGNNISFFEQRLGLGRTSGGFDLASDHEIFAWATTSTTTLASFASINIPGGVYGFLQDRSYIYLATRNINKEFQIFDPVLSTTTAIFSLPIAPETMTCDADSIYILANRAPFIYKIIFR